MTTASSPSPIIPDPHRRRRWLKGLLLVAATAVVAWLSGVRLFSFGGDSMRPGVNPGDWFVGLVGVWNLREPQRFDRLIFEVPPHSRWAAAKIPWMKRLVGLPGERVRLSGADLYINDRKVDAPFLYLDPAAAGKTRPDVSVTLGPREYFVLGDNLDHTTDDSRAMGPIERGLIKGVGVGVVWRAR